MLEIFHTSIEGKARCTQWNAMIDIFLPTCGIYSTEEAHTGSSLAQYKTLSKTPCTLTKLVAFLLADPGATPSV